MRSLLGIVWALAGALHAPALQAEAARSTVVLLHPGPEDLSRRLREEIESLGLEVQTAPELGPAESLEARAREAGAVAAIRVTDVGPRSVEMTIVDRTTGKTVSRRLAVNSPDDPAASELVATRTVELLRASLMELSAPHPARGDIVATPEIKALAPAGNDEPARLSIALGPALLHSPDFGFGAHVFAAASFVPGRLGMSFALLLPMAAARLPAREGEIELFTSQYRLGATLDLLRRDSALGARFQAGVLLARLSLSGEAGSPYLGAQDDALVFGPWLGAALRLRLTSNLSGLLDLAASLTYPRTVVRAAGRELTTFGRPMSSGTAALELSWP